MVITGGEDDSTWQTVAQYSVSLEVTYLAPLLMGRCHHACAKFLDDNGNTNLLVTGGTEYDTGNSRTETTEIYSPVTKKWSYAASLPSARRVARAATWNNLVYLLGGTGNGYANYFDDILRYDQASDSWTNVGKMTSVRGYHVVTTIANVSDICP